MKATDEIKRLGGVEGAESAHFRDKATAEQFVAWLSHNRYESYGVVRLAGGGEHPYSVTYRDSGLSRG